VSFFLSFPTDVITQQTARNLAQGRCSKRSHYAHDKAGSAMRECLPPPLLLVPLLPSCKLCPLLHADPDPGGPSGC
jgi:hypothetical protein